MRVPFFQLKLQKGMFDKADGEVYAIALSASVASLGVPEAGELWTNTRPHRHPATGVVPLV